jgi:hypothetical protein
MSNTTLRADSPALFEPDARLEALAAALVACDHLYDAADDDQKFVVQYETHWALREKINTLQATTLSGLHAKALAAELAFKRDTSAECEGAGSFLDLCHSINRDIAAFAFRLKTT